LSDFTASQFLAQKQRYLFRTTHPPLQHDVFSVVKGSHYVTHSENMEGDEIQTPHHSKPKTAEYKEMVVTTHIEYSTDFHHTQ
jgi:hypothetical protein